MGFASTPSSTSNTDGLETDNDSNNINKRDMNPGTQQSEEEGEELSSRQQNAPPVPPPPSDNNNNENNYLPCFGIHPCLLACAIFYLSLIILIMVSTNNVLMLFINLILSIIPTYLISKYTIKYLKTEELATHHLLNIFLKSAFPLSFIIMFVEFIITILFAYLVIGSSNVKRLLQILSAITTDTETATGQQEAVINWIKKSVPLYKVIILCVCIAIFVAALTEELGKWLLTLQSIKKYASSRERNMKTILTLGIFSSLGLATIENVSFIFSLTSPTTTSTPDAMSWIYKMIEIILRDLLAFPVHIGCTLIISYNWFFNQFYKGLIIAILFHGWFDTVALVFSVLKLYNVVNGLWVDITIIVIQVSSVIIFVMLLCSRLKSIVDRHRIIESNEYPLNDVDDDNNFNIANV